MSIKEIKEGYAIMLPRETHYGIGNKFICLPDYKVDNKIKFNCGTVERITLMGYEWSREHNGILQGLGDLQHIYILSDEKKNEGDWCINIGGSIRDSFPFKISKEFIEISNIKKIILTTDTSISIRYDERFTDITLNGVSINHEFPKPSNDFIENYISTYDETNNLRKVLIVDGDIKIVNELKNNWTLDEVLTLCIRARDKGERDGEILWDEWVQKNILWKQD